MYRIDNATAVPNGSGVPTPAAVGSNPNGFFTGGNPGSGTPATVVDADWANAIQEEIANTITALGITLSKTTRTQLSTSVQTVAAAGYINISTSRTLLNTEAGTIKIDATAGNVTLTLPLANSLGGKRIRYNFYRSDTSGNTVTIALSGGNTLTDIGGSSFTIGSRQTVTLDGDGGTAWTRVALVTRDEFTGSNQSLAAAGYQKLPGGLVLQWATVSVAGGGTTWTYPTTFPNAVVCISGTPRGAAAGYVDGTLVVDTGATTSSVLLDYVGSGTISTFIMAIGY